MGLHTGARLRRRNPNPFLRKGLTTRWFGHLVWTTILDKAVVFTEFTRAKQKVYCPFKFSLRLFHAAVVICCATSRSTVVGLIIPTVFCEAVYVTTENIGFTTFSDFTALSDGGLLAVLVDGAAFCEEISADFDFTTGVYLSDGFGCTSAVAFLAEAVLGIPKYALYLLGRNTHCQ